MFNKYNNLLNIYVYFWINISSKNEIPFKSDQIFNSNFYRNPI